MLANENQAGKSHDLKLVGADELSLEHLTRKLEYFLQLQGCRAAQTQFEIEVGLGWYLVYQSKITVN